MSIECAKRCNLESLLDYRFMGVAKGVGSAEILGRIHLAQMKVGHSYLPCTFTILKDLPFDVLFGLDMLRRHRVSKNRIGCFFFSISGFFSILLLFVHLVYY